MNKKLLALVFNVGLLTVMGLNAASQEKQKFFHEKLERRVDSHGNETFYNTQEGKSYKSDGKGGYIEIKETTTQESTHQASTALSRFETRLNDAKAHLKDAFTPSNSTVKRDNLAAAKAQAQANYDAAVNEAQAELNDTIATLDKAEQDAINAQARAKLDAAKADAALAAKQTKAAAQTWGESVSNLGSAFVDLTWTGNRKWFVAIPAVTLAVVGAYYYWKSQQEEQETEIDILV